MDFGRLPSLLLSLCLHLAVAAMVLWWPVSQAVYPDPSHGTLVSGLVTLGKAGKSVPGSKQETPESRKGVTPSGPENTIPETPTAPETRPEIKPEVKPVEKAPEVAPKPPEPDATPVLKDPEKTPEEKKPETRPEEKRPESKPEEKKPEPEEKKPETKPAETKPSSKPDALANALADIGKQVDKSGDPQGRRGSSSAGRGRGSNLSSALADIGKQVGGAGDDASGRGPGGRGGDGLGQQGAYLDVIHSRVKSNWSWPGRADRRKYSTLVSIQIAANGQITGARILRSSGDAPYDSSVMRALNLTRMLEPPPNPDLMNVDIEFAF